MLGQLRAPVLIVGIDSDVLYPIEEQQRLAAAIPGSTLRIVHSFEGHDGFLLEDVTIGRHIEEFLSDATAAAPYPVQPPPYPVQPSSAPPSAAMKRTGWAFGI